MKHGAIRRAIARSDALNRKAEFIAPRGKDPQFELIAPDNNHAKTAAIEINGC
jgi:hypothetical protein